MKDLVIENVRALQPGKGIVASAILVRGGTIAALDPAPAGTAGAERVDGGNRLLTPGMIDIHTHGICGGRYDIPECVGPGSRKLGAFGTTTAVTTLSGRLAPDLLDRLSRVAAAAAQADGAHMAMLHLEGPFLALPGAGGEGAAGDVHVLEDILDACAGQVRAMSISPDQDNIIPVIEALREHDVRPFITHTRADPEQTLRAIDAGARHATHFYDVFAMPPETDPGVRPVGAVEAVLARPDCSVDFVCDGVHVHPTAIACALAAKGVRGVALITDANSGAGRSPGIYEEGWRQRKIRVCENGGCRVHAPGDPLHGSLAGSALTMDAGIRNLRRWFDLPEEDLWAMATSVPASIMGLKHKGVIEAGADADLVLWDEPDEGPRPLRTWLAGRPVYDAAG